LRYVERGKARVLTIGDATRMKCKSAREVARKRLAELAKLGLPTKPRRAASQAKVVTFSELAERYLTDRPFAWKPTTEAVAARRIRLNLCEAFGDMQVAAIRKQDVMRWRDASSDRPEDCNSCIAHLSGVMQYAERLGLRPKGSNPARGVPRYKGELKERFLDLSEYRRLHQRLAEYNDGAFVSAVRLLIHTGARRGEIINLTWGEVSRGRFELKDSKTGPKSILLSRQAETVLASLPRGADDAPVFPRFHGRGEIFAYEWSKLRRIAGLPDVRLHDLRHSYASIAIQNGIQLEAIGRLLGHTSAETTARYAHLSDGVITQAAEAVSADILRLMRFSHEAL
jgi:integrase